MPRVLAYGDSNTYGRLPSALMGDGAALPIGERWPDHMGAALGSRWDVVVEGLPGRTTVYDDPKEGAYRNGLTVLPAILYSHAPIDVLVVCLGTNDQQTLFGLGATEVSLCVARLLRHPSAAETCGSVIAVCPPPLTERGEVGSLFRGVEDRVGDLWPQFERWVPETGAIPFRAGDVITVDEADGIHWNAEAHRALGQALAPVVQRSA